MTERRVRQTGKDTDGISRRRATLGQTWSSRLKADAIDDIGN